MALDVIIEQKGLFKKKLEFKNVFELLSSPLSYGLQNGAYVLKETDDEDLNEKYVIIFDASQIGRGLSMFVEENKIELSLPLSCTEYDLELFYDVIRQLTSSLKVKEIDQDGLIISVDELVELESKQKDFLKNYIDDLVDSDKYDVSTFPATLFPISVDAKKLLKDVKKEERLKVFSEYFESRQEMDVFYPSPLLYQNKNTEAIIGGYSLTETVRTVLPYTPNAFLQLGSDVDVDWYVLLGEIVKDEYAMLGNVKYDIFMERINIDACEPFDARHFIFELDKDAVEMFNDVILSNEEIMS